MDAIIPKYILNILAALHGLLILYFLYWTAITSIAGIYFGRRLPKKPRKEDYVIMWEALITINRNLRRSTKQLFYLGIAFYLVINASFIFNYFGPKPLHWVDLPVHVAVVGQLFIFQGATSFDIVTNIRLRIYMGLLFLYPFGAGLQIGTGDYGQLLAAAIWFVMAFKFFFMMVRQHTRLIEENITYRRRKEAEESLKKYSPESNN